MNENLCMGCMENKGDLTVCPYCGYSENGPRIQSCLPPRSLIGGRYLAGKVLSYNGEGVTYIGYDTVADRKVSVREFFPDALVTRAEDGKTVEVRPNCQIQFKTYLSDFLEVNEKVARLRSISCLAQILDIAEDNGTVYAISEYPLGETLESFLERRGMMLTWGETYDLMMPVIRTMQLIHEDGIIHRGISPQTVYITPSGKAKLTGFCISAVRAARTELAAELYAGFSAPEQYSSTAPHGTWTDIYAICAVLYLCVTGLNPPEALIRSPETELIRPRERNETVPTRVSQAIMQGLALRPEDRIHTIPELVSSLNTVKTGTPSEAPTIAITGENLHETSPRRPPEQRRPATPERREPPRQQRPAGSHPPAQQRPQGQRPPQQRPQGQRPQGQPNRQPVQQKAAQARGKAEEKKSGQNIILKTMLITLPILLVILIFTFWFLFGNREQTESYKDNIVTSTSDEGRPSESSGFGNYTPPSSTVSSSEPASSSTPESVSSSEPSSESSSEPSSEAGWSMVQLVGRTLEDVQADGEITGHITLEPEFMYSDSTEQGIIMWQDTSVGTQVADGTTVQVRVSKGSQYVTLPDWEKKTQEEYTAELDALSIPYQVEIRESTNYPSGYVIGTDHLQGTRYDLESGTVVTVYVCENNQSY